MYILSIEEHLMTRHMNESKTVCALYRYCYSFKTTQINTRHNSFSLIVFLAALDFLPLYCFLSPWWPLVSHACTFFERRMEYPPEQSVETLEGHAGHLRVLVFQVRQAHGEEVGPVVEEKLLLAHTQ